MPVPAITLRTNTLKTDRATLMGVIQEEAANIRTTTYAPEGIALAALATPIPQWSSFQQGWFQVQDEAAQLVVHMLAPQPGETVWDACAGLGTKTAHIAQLMNNRGCLLASDRSAAKLNRLSLEMQRLGVTIATTQKLDLIVEDASDSPIFDRILVDAPCSGLGVLQKNPDGKWRGSGSGVGKISISSDRPAIAHGPPSAAGGQFWSMRFAVSSPRKTEL